MGALQSAVKLFGGIVQGSPPGGAEGGGGSARVPRAGRVWPLDPGTTAHLDRIWDVLDPGATAQLVASARALIASGSVGEGVALLREAPWGAGPRREVIRATLACSALDPEFQARIAEGDGARDTRQWAAAERAYASALGLYPWHGGYRIQLGHVLKEQERFVEAEVEYRSALALGCERAALARHLAFVCSRQGLPDTMERPVEVLADWLDAAPTGEDVATLGAVIWHEPHLAAEEIARLLRSANDVSQVAVMMLGDPRAAQRNARLASLMSLRP